MYGASMSYRFTSVVRSTTRRHLNKYGVSQSIMKQHPQTDRKSYQACTLITVSFVLGRLTRKRTSKTFDTGSLLVNLSTARNTRFNPTHQSRNDQPSPAHFPVAHASHQPIHPLLPHTP